MLNKIFTGHWISGTPFARLRAGSRNISCWWCQRGNEITTGKKWREPPSVRLVLKVGRNKTRDVPSRTALQRTGWPITLPSALDCNSIWLRTGKWDREDATHTVPGGETGAAALGALTSLTGGASEPRCTLTDAVVRGARGPVLTVAGQRAVGAPASLSTHAVTVDTWNKACGQGWVRGWAGGRLCDVKSETRTDVRVSKPGHPRQQRAEVARV